MRWAMIGRSPGNGHPYSWSAIVNGFDRGEMRTLEEFLTIPAYLEAAPPGEFGVGDARVTHLWMPDRAEAEFCARCARVPTVVDRPEDVIGEVDAVVIPTDNGETHLAAVRPFLDAGLPVFIDKPLCLDLGDLAEFVRRRAAGARLLSCSSARFAREYLRARSDPASADAVHVAAPVPHRWETYGIHGLEAAALFLGARALRVATVGSRDRSITTVEYPGGRLATIACLEGGFPGLWVDVNGPHGNARTAWRDSFTSFRDTLRAFHDYLATGRDPWPFDDTVELMKTVACALRSRERGGVPVDIPKEL